MDQFLEMDVFSTFRYLILSEKKKIVSNMVYGFVDSRVNTLKGIRNFLNRLDKGILIALYNRSKYPANDGIYVPDTTVEGNFRGSEFDLIFRNLLFGDKKRFKIADEVPFYHDQPFPKDKPFKNEYPNGSSTINLCDEIMRVYTSMIKYLCGDGKDGKHVSTVRADANALDLFSTRVHRGGVCVADIKRREDPNRYNKLVTEGANAEILDMITDPLREAEVLDGVWKNAGENGVDQDFARRFYKDHVMRLTKQVQLARMYELVPSD
jgi:chorismate mutase